MSAGKNDAGFNPLAKIWEAQWGRKYDSEVMRALWELVTAEEWVREDKANGTPEALAISQDALNQAMDRREAIRAKLEADYGIREAAATLERHFTRLDAWQAEQQQAEPEIALASFLVDWLGQASGTAPTTPELNALIESLKAYSKPRDIPLSQDSEEIRPMRYAAALKAQRFHGEDAARWVKVYHRQLITCAERIEKEQLFRRQVIRTDKFRVKGFPELRGGSDRSSLLYGLIDPKYKPPT